MKYYISQTDVSFNEEGKLSITEVVLTKPDSHKSTANLLRKLKRLEVENIHICAHPKNSRRYGSLLRAQGKRHKKKYPKSKLTVGDLAVMTKQADQELASKDS